MLALRMRDRRRLGLLRAGRRRDPIDVAGTRHMKTLLLVRHAESSRGDPSLRDRDRPLNDRGRQDASWLGRRLRARGLKPDRLMSSPALRALTTAKLLAAELGCEPDDIVVVDRLYASSAAEVLALIRALDPGPDCVMLVGHNPEFSDVARRLSSTMVDMPTCAIAEFRFDTNDWSDVGRITPESVVHDSPGAPTRD
jgi:phosphohistidine phosphatase